MTVLSTPILAVQDAFDPHYEHTIDFTYNDNQAVKNRLVITDNETSTDIYDKEQIGMRLSHTIPANTLMSGRQYLAKIKVFDQSGNESDYSSPVLFYCFTSPLFQFTTNNDSYIHSANLNVELQYSQSENELLQEYTYELYQYDKTKIYTSDVFYSNDNLLYTFYGLKNDSIYYIRAIGKTSHGMVVDTGHIKINVTYIMIPANVLFKVENNCKNGYMTIESGIIDIGYVVDNENYSFSNGEVTLVNNKVTYNKGFQIDGDFSVFIKARKLPMGIFFIMPTENGDINLSIMKSYGNYYCKLTAPSPIGEYSRYAELPKANLADTQDNLISDTDGNFIMTVDLDYWDAFPVVFELKRKNNLYGLKAYYEPNSLLINIAS